MPSRQARWAAVLREQLHAAIVRMFKRALVTAAVPNHSQIALLRSTASEAAR
jgi:uncharacterized lipoprotein YmbA